MSSLKSSNTEGKIMLLLLIDIVVEMEMQGIHGTLKIGKAHVRCCSCQREHVRREW